MVTLTSLALAVLGQLYEPDAALIQALEHWVIQQQDPNIDRVEYLPNDVYQAVDAWNDTDWRVRKAANREILQHPEWFRWMFWAERSRDVNTQLYAQAMIRSFVLCKGCGGTGYCKGFTGDQRTSDTCTTCGQFKPYHDATSDRLCRRCYGYGYLEQVPWSWSLRR